MEYGKANAVDGEGNYINGCLFQNTINVNPNGTTSLTAPGATTQIAMTKYNPSGELIWAFHVGGAATSEAPHGIGCDALNNIYVTGYFGSSTVTGPLTADFNPLGGGTITTQGNEDCFVAKYDKNGVYQWAFGLGNTGANTQERAWDIVTDPSGNCYVTGGFHGSVYFNPLGTAMVKSLPDTLAGLFISKYNSAGICQWVITINAQCTSVFNEGYATADFDLAGNLFVAGNFRGSGVNINPLGTAATFNSSGLTDIFIASYSTTNGMMNWANKIGGPSAEIVSPGGLRCDKNGNLFFTGRLSGTGSVDFDPGPGTTSISNSSLYLASFNRSGGLRCAAGMNSGSGDGGHRVAFDSNNDVYLAGWMNGSATFGTIARTAYSNTADVFLAKYNNNLSACFWAFNFGGTGSSANSICAGLTLDKQNCPIITGQLYGANADVDPSATGQFLLSSSGQNDCFIVKYNSDGSLWRNHKLSLNAFIEGHFNGTTQTPDTIRVYLRNNAAPYQFADSAFSVLGNNGNADLYFHLIPSGQQYYAVVRHRNSIETWSTTPIPIGPGTTVVNLTTDSSYAYGANLKKKNGKWCIYSGDTNQDGAIDFTDIIAIDNDQYNFTSGYVSTDLTGDDFVDFTDLLICDNNQYNFVSVVSPATARSLQRIQGRRETDSE
jgi:hypothetical protein